MRPSRMEVFFSLALTGEKLKKVILQEYVKGWSLEVQKLSYNS